MFLDQSPRLRRYFRKDYTQLVDFPVEIVGRDGQVRRFSFDESVRLYHRRIHSVALRYEEPDMIDAEVQHCRQRVEQLRRSYLEHHGFPALREAGRGGVLGTPLAAEIAAFIRRTFAGGVEVLASLTVTGVSVAGISVAGISVTGVSAPGTDACFLHFADSGRSYMLYAWRIDGDPPGGSPPRGARALYQETRRRLGSAPSGDGVERLFVASEAADVGILLAGTGEWAGGSDREITEEEDLDLDNRDPWMEGMRALFDGRVPRALLALEGGMERQPSRKALPQAAALVSLLDAENERGEFNAHFGVMHHPRDLLLGYLLAVAWCRNGRLKDAEDAWHDLHRLHGSAALLSLFGAFLALRRGALVTAWQCFAAILAGSGEPRFATRGARHGQLVILQSVSLALLGLLAMALSLLLPLPWMGIGALGGALISGYSLHWVRQQGLGALTNPRHPGMRVLSPELMPRDRRAPGEPHH